MFGRPALQRPLLSLLGALACLLLAVGTGQAYWVNLGAPSFTRLCPTHFQGDREYAGHGPEVQASAGVLIGYSDGLLYVGYTMIQVETKSDWSGAMLHDWIPVYSPPAGQKFTYIWNAPSSDIYYIDTDHAVDWFYPADNLVSAFAIKGDTSGKDIGNCTSDDSYLSVYFEPIWVWVE
jgi:hypothetical protein